MDLQIPGLGSLGFNAIGEMAVVPFDATRMWMKNHPQVMQYGWEILDRGWAMGQVTTSTLWRLWALVFVYSKTGQFKLKRSKGETVGGFAIDCVRSLMYLLIFAAISVFLMRVLNVVLGLAGMVGWLIKGLFWVLKQVLGFGLVR
jgi:hypothetical protein